MHSPSHVYSQNLPPGLGQSRAESPLRARVPHANYSRPLVASSNRYLACERRHAPPASVLGLYASFFGTSRPAPAPREPAHEAPTRPLADEAVQSRRRRQVLFPAVALRCRQRLENRAAT